MSSKPSDYLLQILKDRKEQLRKYKRMKVRTRDERIKRSLEKICNEDERALKKLRSLLPNKASAGDRALPSAFQVELFLSEKIALNNLQKCEKRYVNELEKLMQNRDVPSSVKNTVVAHLIGLGQEHIRNLEILKY